MKPSVSKPSSLTKSTAAVRPEMIYACTGKSCSRAQSSDASNTAAAPSVKGVLFPAVSVASISAWARLKVSGCCSSKVTSQAARLLAKRFEACGWNVIGPIDGHDVGSVDLAIARAHASATKPTLVICKTTIGRGAPTRAGTAKASALIDMPHWDLEVLADLSAVMREASICGLGQAAPNPVDCVVKYFAQELA